MNVCFGVHVIRAITSDTFTKLRRAGRRVFEFEKQFQVKLMQKNMQNYTVH